MDGGLIMYFGRGPKQGVPAYDFANACSVMVLEEGLIWDRVRNGWWLAMYFVRESQTKFSILWISKWVFSYGFGGGWFGVDYVFYEGGPKMDGGMDGD